MTTKTGNDGRSAKRGKILGFNSICRASRSSEQSAFAEPKQRNVLSFNLARHKNTKVCLTALAEMEYESEESTLTRLGENFEDASAWYDLGRVYTHMNREPDPDFKTSPIFTPEECFEMAIRIDPYYAKAYYRLGSLQLSHGLYTTAMANLQKSVDLVPTSGWSDKAEQELSLCRTLLESHRLALEPASCI